MKHTDFEESNFTYTAPRDMPDCSDLKAYVDGERIISAWDLTPIEILNLLTYRRCWLHIWGQAQPPVYLETTSPFVATDKVIYEADKEKARSIKDRLARSFLISQGYSESYSPA